MVHTIALVACLVLAGLGLVQGGGLVQPSSIALVLAGGLGLVQGGTHLDKPWFRWRGGRVSYYFSVSSRRCRHPALCS